MPLNKVNISTGTIPYPNFKNGDAMNDNLFDENNDALLTKINEIGVHVNNIKNVLSSIAPDDSGANNITVDPIDGLTGTTIQAILVELYEAVKAMVLNQVPDNSITDDKMAYFDRNVTVLDAYGYPTEITYTRPGSTLYMKRNYSNANANKNYQTVVEKYYDTDGTTLKKTITYTLTFLANGLIDTTSRTVV